jgi:hypothetical protein
MRVVLNLLNFGIELLQHLVERFFFLGHIKIPAQLRQRSVCGSSGLTKGRSAPPSIHPSRR